MAAERGKQLWNQASKVHFHRWAEHYDRDIINILLFRPSYRRVLAQLRHWVRRGMDNIQMLDVGCGTGTLTLQCAGLIPQIQHTTGLDMSDNMIAKAQEKTVRLALEKKARFTVGDAEHLPFQDNSFNIVTCCNSFHHYPHKHHAIAEMFRVLKDGGYVILIDGCRDEPFGYFIFEVCVARVEQHVHHCTDKQFHRLLHRTGFSDIRQNAFGVCPPALMNIARANK